MAEHDGKFIRYMDAIKEINPKAQCNYQNNDLSTINWTNGTTPIPIAEIEAKRIEIEARDAHIFQRERDYPSIADQLDDIYHNGVDGWKATIKATKDKYPKP